LPLALVAPEILMGIGIRELLVILLIALVLFGAKKLRNVGSDLGAAVRNFKKSVSEGDDEQTKQLSNESGKDAGFHDHADAAKSDSKPNA
jgi:sec-independent protein translocase protein TatA